MRRSVRLYGARGLGFACLGLIVAAGVTLPAQQPIVPGTNVNMVSGTKYPEGDPYLQRQNEPSSAVSTRNPLHILGGANDYRTVDIPHPSDELRTQRMNSDAWVGVFKSLDGGQHWNSTLLPGYPQDPARTAPLWGYHAATDPFIRAGTNGMFYYAGLAFNRGDNAPSAIFVARYMDMNNLEAGDPIVHLDTRIVDSDLGTRFLDKTAFATDIPRTAATCSFAVPLGDTAGTVVPQTIPAGNIYLAYSAFTGAGATEQSVILFTRSTDCGTTWSPPKALSTGSRLVQNAQIAVDPATGYVYVSWRRFRYLSQDDAVMVVRSTNGGATFGKVVRVAGVAPFDQPTRPNPGDPPTTREASFRSNGFQTMAVDATGRVYLAWTQRGHAPLRPSLVDGDARIVISTSTNGTAWTVPRAIQPGGLGHQVMPALTFHAGRLRLLYYDLREDVSQVFAPFVNDVDVVDVRHTLDVFVAQATPGVAPVFTTARLSDYASGFLPHSDTPVRLQFNPPNLPLFRLGTAPFMGDYIDSAPAPAYVQNPDGSWVHNTAPSTSATSHAFWTDNRDVRPPPDGDWVNYSPPRSAALGTTSRFDPSLPVLACRPDHEGMRNQNIYTARVTEGLFVSAPGNNKPLGTLQRAFVVVAENATALVRSFRLTITNQPVGGAASFLQFSPLPTLDVSVPPFSSVARTVFASSSDERARVTVSLVEITTPGGALVPGGLAGAVVLNADPSPESPRLQNPRLQNPRLQNPLIADGEAYNAGITNAVFAVPRLQNPRLQNPTIENPRLQNDALGNPRLQNDAVANPGVVSVTATNTELENPRLQNPRLQNPRLQNQALDDAKFIDTSWSLTNDGNTTAAYTINLVLNETIPTGFASQLLIHKTTTTPASIECNLAEQLHTVLIANIPDPEFVPFAEVANPRLQNPRLQNPTLALAPGESATVTLRIVDPDRFDDVTYDATGAVTPAAAAQSVNTEDIVVDANGVRSGSSTVAVPLTITTTALPPAAPGTPYTRSLQTLASLGPLTCSVVSGTLPPGVSLSSDGTITGTPTVPGNYRFTVRCVDANGNEDDQPLFIQIEPPVPAGFDAAWNGADTDWSNPDNWSPRGVPQAEDRVYIPATITVVPTLTRHETIRDLVVEPGATVDTNGFTLTITHNADAGRTIIGTGTTILTGDGGVATGVFSNLEVRGRITLNGAVTVTGRLTLTAGARLHLNGQSLIVGGQLSTNVTTGAAPVVTGPASSFIVAGVLVNGLVLENAPLTIDSSTGGALTQFDHVRFGTFAPAAVQLTVSHPGLAASFAMNGVSFLTTPTTGRLVQANDTNDGANTLIVDIVRAVPADGSAATATAGGAVVNWISDPDDANLAVTQSVSPIPVAAGTPLTYVITVVNGGPAAATGVTLNPGVPVGATNVTASTTQGACALGSGGLSCDLGSIPAGSQVVVTVSFIPPGTGTLVTTASVTGTGQDSSAGNNTHTIAATVVAAGAGVSLTLGKTGSAPSVAINAPFTYGLTVTNAGLTTATGVMVVDPVPAGLTLSNVTASQGTCSIAAGQVVCVVGTLTPGQVATMTLSATASAAGLITNAASVTSNELELTPADNFAVVQTMVLATAGCSVPTFTGPVSFQGSPGPMAVVKLVDMNHDGHLDAVATREIQGGGVDVFLNDGTGQFAPPRFTSTVTSPWIHVVADFNGDTHPDVITSSDRGPGDQFTTLRLLTNDGTGTLTLVPTFSIPFGGSFVAEDVDRDGDTDLVIASATSDDLLLLRNNGQANFAAPVTLLTGSSGFATFGDFNGDDRTDVIAVLGADGYAVLLADTSGGFLPPVVHPVPGGAFTVSVADLNGDGDLDLLIAEGEDDDSLTGQAFVALGDGAGDFGAPAAAASSAFFFPQLVDVTGEGRADIVGISSLSSFGVWPGNGLGGFSAPAHFANATYYWPTVGDVNGDGRVDIVTGDRHGQLNVFLNNCGAAPANLSVAVSESADPVNEGDELTYTVTVTNQTANVATGLRLTSVLTAQGDDEPEDPNVTVLAITSSDGGTLTTTGSTYTWTLPAQGPNARAIFTFRLRPLGGGALQFATGVTSDGTETDPSDNAATETTTVTAVSRQIVVTNTNDSGPGSLRQAIIESNDPGDVDTIGFNIQPGGPQTITVLSELPDISAPAVIDGTTQPGFSGTPIIELNGNGLAASGLFITGHNATVRGLVINRFGQNGILIFGSGNIVEGNYIGLDLTGSVARANRIGVALLGSTNQVGGTTAAARNIISGNQLSGISIENATTTGNLVQGNYIGTNSAATAALANGGGVFVGPGSTANTIGGTAPGAGNVISGNTGDGISINAGSTGNRVQGNRIGTNAAVTAAVPNTSAGVRVTAGTNTIGGTVSEARNIISGNGQSGVVLGANSVESVVQGNYIGTNLSGTSGIPNTQHGVVLNNALGVTIGGTQAGAGNVISGNLLNGINVSVSAGNFIQGNHVGTNAAGTAAVANGNHGISINGSDQITIGGTATGARNVISGNTGEGITIGGSGESVTVQGNLIGTNAAGTAAVGNRRGIFSTSEDTRIGGTAATARNVISGNAIEGIVLSGIGVDGSTVEGNFIGTDISGTAPIPNLSHGIRLSNAVLTRVGGTLAGAGNLISGNAGDGVSVTGATTSGTLIQGNLIGLNAAGTGAIGNSNGITVAEAAGTTIGGIAPGAGNVVSGNATGIQLLPGSSTTLVQGNRIGTSASGTAAVPNGAGININASHGNTIGGGVANAGNIVSGNTGNGIWINAANGNIVQGNRIGTNVDGNAAVPNGFGMFVMGASNVIGGAAAAAGNLISGNTDIGISVANGATSTLLQGNRIGTNAAGTSALPNGSHGVFLDGAGTTVGGTLAAAANTVAHNGRAGIRVNSGTGHAIFGNAVFANVELGIDIGPGGVTLNDVGDPDAGANNLQNFPVLTSAVSSGSAISVQGTLDSTPNTTFTVEIFSAAADPSGFGEGAQPLSRFSVTTNAAGAASFTTEVPSAGVTSLTATATDASGNTSEFSANRVVAAGGPQTFVVTNTSDSGAGSLRQAMLDANASANTLDTIAFSVAGSILLQTALPMITDRVIIDGATAPGFAGQPVVEVDGSLLPDPYGFHITAGNSTVRGLAISGFGALPGSTNGIGIVLENLGNNVVEGNYIGTNLTGQVANGNFAYGVFMDSSGNRIGGTTAAARNVISGNLGSGVGLSGASNNVIQGNYIGLDRTGTADLGNNIYGIVVSSGSSNTVGGPTANVRNIISGNGLDGINLSAANGNAIQGNYIGTNAVGAASVGNGRHGINLQGQSNAIGGSAVGAGNVLSGNSQFGVNIGLGSNNSIVGNLIGVSASGLAALGNASHGLNIAPFGTSTTIQGNVLSGNVGSGVVLNAQSSGSLIQGNFIGTAGNGTTLMPNQANGVAVSSSSNTIGKTTGGGGTGNVIAGNALQGIVVGGAVTSNVILGNSTFSNAGLGIDLGINGVTPNDTNDGDVGANNLQNFPALTSAVLGSTLEISGSLNSIIGRPYVIEYLRSSSCDSLGFGEGQVFVGQTILGATGQATTAFAASFPPAGFAAGQSITATATSSDGTSEFSACVLVTALVVPQTFVVTNTNDSGAGSLRQAILDANASSSTLDTIAFNIPGTGPHTISPASFLPTATGPVVIDGTTEPDFAGTPVIELDGTNAGGTSNGLWLMGASTIRGLAINRFGTGGPAGGGGGAGIVLQGTGNIVEGNVIGANPAGTIARPNRMEGIWTDSSSNSIGGTTAAARNVISGNGRHGILITGATATGNVIRGNYIGTSRDGTADLGNSEQGVLIMSAANTIDGGNVISGNGGSGVWVLGAPADNNTISGNFIGTDHTGTAPIANTVDGVTIGNGSNNVVGGTAASGRNVISGNTRIGVLIEGAGATANQVVGNYIGTDVSGAFDVGNGFDGVFVSVPGNAVGGALAAEGNLISGNGRAGVYLGGAGLGNNSVRSNRIGVDAAGTGALPNSIGIFVESSGNTIGEFSLGAGNIIARNTGAGIDVRGTGNAINANRIEANGGLGIDLGGDGVTANDADDPDAGANGLQNYPVLGNAVLSATQLDLQATLNTVPGRTYTIEYFRSTSCDPSGFGEGAAHLGVTTTGTFDNPTAVIPLSFAAGTFAVGEFITATTTSTDGTSEFSACLQIPGLVVDADLSITKTDSTDPVVRNTPFTYTLTVHNAGPGAATGVAVSDALPSGMTASEAISTRGSCTIEGESVSCLIGALAASEGATITLTVNAGTAGLNTNQAEVSADQNDPNLLNNVVTETTMVLAAEACTTAGASGPTILQTGGNTFDVLTGDLNGDGNVDLVSPVPSLDSVAVFLGDGTGGFGAATLFAAGDGPIEGVLLDLNADGRLDLALEGARDAYVLLGNGAGGFAAPVTHSFEPAVVGDVRSGDFNGDGRPDLVISTTSDSNTVRVMLGDGSGGFAATATTPLPAAAIRVVPLDVNEDAKTDLVVSYAFGSLSSPVPDFLSVLLGDGTGNFAAPATVALNQTSAQSLAFALGDLNQDGHQDLGVTEITATGRQFLLLFGDGAGSFTTQLLADAPATINVVASGDVNGDGFPDLLGSAGSLLQVWLGNGTEAFTLVEPALAPFGGEVRLADFNGDDRLDVAVAITQGGGVSVLLNACNQPATNLTLAMTDTPDPVDEGSPLTYAATITNNSATGAAANVTFTHTLPLNVSDISAVPTQGTCSVSSRLVTCNLGSLAPGANASVNVIVTPTTAATLSTTAGVSSNMADADAADNTVTVQTTVTAVGRTIVVTNANNAGTGSLRQAIVESNADAGDVDRIHFNIPGSGPHAIAPLTPFQTLLQPVVIDATTQPGYAGAPLVQLVGSATLFNGLGVAGGNTTVRGLSITGFPGNGIHISGPGGNVIEGNHVGINPGGTLALGNANSGVAIVNSSNNRIGGPLAGQRNVISTNGSDGVSIAGAASTGNAVQGNRIGTDPGGTLDLGNGQHGVRITTSANSNTIGGTSPGSGNLISGNGANGIHLDAVNNTSIEGNKIGADDFLTTAIENFGHGIEITNAPNNTIGGVTTAARNVISGNRAGGVSISGSTANNNTIQNNFIGTNGSATSAIANGLAGVTISGASSTQIVGNVISGNGQDGVWVFGSGSLFTSVRGNWIGTTSTLNNTLIPNARDGIRLDGTSNAAIGSATPADRNIIGGNAQSGIGIYGGAAANVIRGNTIGGAGSPVNTGNTLDGIHVNSGSNNTIGGLNANDGNIISFNQRTGIALFTGTGNAILGNSIVANSSLGIDFANDLVTANDNGDADTGANLQQNFPILTSEAGGVTGTLNSTPNSVFRIEFFGNTACDASGNGEGQTFLGFVSATTNGSGTATIPLWSADAGQFVTATATDGNNNTSEFSACRLVSGPIGLTLANVQLVGVGREETLAVTLPSAAPSGGVTVTVTSEDSNVLSVAPPGTVSIGAGQTFGIITLTGVQPGTVTLTASAPGYADGTLSVAVTQNLISSPLNLIVPFGQSVALPVNIGPSPAPAGGLTLNVVSLAPAIIQVLTPQITVAEGAVSANATVRGVLIGGANVTVSNPAYSPSTTSVTSTAELNILQASASFNDELPAPALTIRLESGGTPTAAQPALTVFLESADPACVAVVASATIPAGLVSTTFTPAYAGGATLPCTTTVTASANNLVSDVVSITVNPRADIFSPGPMIVGSGLMVSTNAILGTVQHGGVDVTITSTDPDRVVVSRNTETAGTGTITFTIPNGQQSVPYVVQGLENTTGSATVTLSASGFTGTTHLITLVAPGAEIHQLDPTTSTLTLDDTDWYLQVGIPNEAGTALSQVQLVRPGLPLVLTLTNSSASVAQIRSDEPVTVGQVVTKPIQPGTYFTRAKLGDTSTSWGLGFEALANGSTSVTVSGPGNLRTMTSTGVRQVEVTGSSMTPPGPVLVGAGLMVFTGAQLSASGHGGVDVTITSTDPAKVLVSADGTSAGAASTTVTVPNGQVFVPYYVHGVENATGSPGITLVASGFGEAGHEVNVVSPGVELHQLDATMSTLSGEDKDWYLQIGIPNIDGTALSLVQVVRPGSGMVFTLTNTNATVGRLRSDEPAATGQVVTKPINPGTYFTFAAAEGTSWGLAFEPLANGSTTVSVSGPPGVQTMSITGIRQVTVADAGITAPGTVTVGSRLMTFTAATLSAANHGGIQVTVTSTDPSKVLLSPDGIMAGTASIQVPMIDGQTFVPYFVLGVANATGTATVTISADEFGDASHPVEVVQSGVEIHQLDPEMSNLSADDNDWYLQVGVPNADGTALLYIQVVQPGPPLQVTLTNSQSTVGRLHSDEPAASGQSVTKPIMPGTYFSIGTGPDPIYGLGFEPLANGTTVVTATGPAGVRTMAATGVRTVTVSTPRIIVSSAETVGAGLQVPISATLNGSQHGGVNVLITSTAPGLVLVSTSTTTAGESSISVPVADNTTAVPFVIQALENVTGTAIVSLSTDGFTTATMTVTVTQSAIEIVGLPSQIAAGAPEEIFWYVQAGLPHPFAPGFVLPQTVRGGSPGFVVTLSVNNSSVRLRSDEPDAVGATVAKPIAPGNFLTVAVPPAGGSGLGFEPLAAGTVVVSATGPAGVIATEQTSRTVIITP